MLLILFLSLLLSGALVRRCRSVVSSCRKRALVARLRSVRSDAPDGIGISVLVTGLRNLAQLEALLGVEYARYEVVVALDADHSPEFFERLATRYRMIRVAWQPTGELPAEGVRRVFRSRRRCFRRLLLVDCAGCAEAPLPAMDAAACVATYDLLLPLAAGAVLKEGAVERLVVEVGERPAGEIELVRTRVGTPLYLIARRRVVAAGGFATRPERRVGRRARRDVWEPLLSCRSRWRRFWHASAPARIVGTVGVLLALGALVAAGYGRWPLAALVSTLLFVWMTAHYALQTVVCRR